MKAAALGVFAAVAVFASGFVHESATTSDRFAVAATSEPLTTQEKLENTRRMLARERRTNRVLRYRLKTYPWTTAANIRTGKTLAATLHGWRGEQWRCLFRLWDRESGWWHKADNPRSDAYGIPQALPGSKMATVAGDYRGNSATQIVWGLRYIRGRYGAPCNALAHSNRVGWY